MICTELITKGFQTGSLKIKSYVLLSKNTLIFHFSNGTKSPNFQAELDEKCFNPGTARKSGTGQTIYQAAFDWTNRKN